MILNLIKFMNRPIVFSLTLYFIVAISLFFGLTSITIGGFLLIVGAWYIYSGNMYFSVMSYMGADACWLHNAYLNDDLLGAVTVTIGIMTGLVVTYKMKVGVFYKSIRKED
jgi:hypothetical protein